jgi:hypothetical protein
VYGQPNLLGLTSPARGLAAAAASVPLSAILLATARHSSLARGVRQWVV